MNGTMLTAHSDTTGVPPALLASARLLWDYLASFSRVEPADAIVVCCSYDLRVCDYACGLLRAGVAPRLLFSGDQGNWTRGRWPKTEAETFRDRALELGADPAALLIEPRATHLGENLAFSRALLPEVTHVLLVTKPNTLLRALLTAPIQWPEVTALAAGPDWKFPEQVSPELGVVGVIEEMVGDLQRIRDYPAKGFQVAHVLPDEVLHAWQQLVDAGYVRHLQR